MCGIVGTYHFDTTSLADSEWLAQRIAHVRHRGPEGHGIWVNRNVGLAHARLAFLDFHSGEQPMRGHRGTVISYNGEIYNAAELRAELIVQGYPFQSQSDTEVLLAAYEVWGTSAWNRLNGMFAFALYDPEQEATHLVRDREGIKPLFYKNSSEVIRFASELAPSDVSLKEVDAGGVIQFMLFGRACQEPHSLLGSWKQVPTGCDVRIGHDGFTSFHWAQYPERMSGEVMSTSHVRSKLRHLLHLSVGRQAISEVPIGVFLSGGIDSAIIVALAKTVCPNPPRTFSIALEGDDEELFRARLTANLLGTIHSEVQVSSAEFFSAMRHLVSLRGVPVGLPNEILIYLLSEAASSEVKAVLSGEGADELFGGYAHFLEATRLYRRVFRSGNASQSLEWHALRRQYSEANFMSSSKFLASITSWWSTEQLQSILRPEFRDLMKSQEFSDPYVSTWSECTTLHPELPELLFLMRFNLPHLLNRLDSATMAASIEGRVPYVDRDLVNYILSLPLIHLLPDNSYDKPLLRTAVSDLLPDTIRCRPKCAFDARLELLLNSPDGRREIERIEANDAMSLFFNMEELRKHVKASSNERSYRRLWLLISLSMWLNQNI